MPLDVTATKTIRRPSADLAAFLRDPANDPVWIGGIRSARLLGDGPVGVGSQVERVASFLGRRIEYVNEVTAMDDQHLAMRSVRSPFPMTVTYSHRDRGNGSTEVSVRVQGDASGSYRMPSPLLAAMVRRNITADLRRLATVLGG